MIRPSPDRAAVDVPTVSWVELRRRLRETWEQGQHFSILAQTGGGKTYFAANGLLPLWRYTIVLDAKGDDPALAGTGTRVRTYPSAPRRRIAAAWSRQQDEQQHWRIAPEPDLMASAFGDALNRIYRARNWVVLIDETRLFSDPRFFGLGKELDKLWLFARYRGISVIAGSQAPRLLPGAFYEQPDHFLIGKIQDDRSIKRLGEISGDTDTIMAVVPTLSKERHEFLYVGPSGMAITRMERPRR